MKSNQQKIVPGLAKAVGYAFVELLYGYLVTKKSGAYQIVFRSH